MTKFLTREQILAAQGFKTEEVEAWGGSVLVRGLSAVEVTDLGVGMMGEDGMDTAKAITLFPKIVAYALVDEGGNQLLSENDVRQLSGESVGVMQNIVNVAFRLSGLTAPKEDDAKNE